MYDFNEMSNVNPIDEKIELLHDFCILRRNATNKENAVRKILETCTERYQMDIKLRDLLAGRETLEDFINRHHMLFVRQDVI